MGFFDDVSSFFGIGDSPEQGPIAVPLPYGHDTGANDPAVQAAQARFSAACQREDALKAREPTERQLAEGRQSDDWMRKVAQAQSEHDSLQVQYESCRTKAEGGDLYEDEKQALYQRFTLAYQKLKSIKDFHDFAHGNPVSKYMDPGYQAELQAAGMARFQAQNELDAARRSAAAR